MENNVQHFCFLPDGNLYRVNYEQVVNQEETIQQLEWAHNQPKGGLNKEGKIYVLPNLDALSFPAHFQPGQYSDDGE